MNDADPVRFRVSHGPPDFIAPKPCLASAIGMMVATKDLDER
jgi:hypothetical protein